MRFTYRRYFWSCSQNSSGFSVAEEEVDEGGHGSCSTEVYVQGSSALLVVAYGCHGDCSCLLQFMAEKLVETNPRRPQILCFSTLCLMLLSRLDLKF